MNAPKRITPCPIIESHIEIRFESQFPDDVIIGIIYNALQPVYENCRLVPLPILQIPPEIRKQDPNFQHKPTHTIKTADFEAHVGPSVLIVGIPGEYPGWERMRSVIETFLGHIFRTRIITNITYAGLKYLDFFKNKNIFEYINLTINFNGETATNKGTIFRTELAYENLVHALQITNSVHVKNNHIDADGSLIDTTTVIKSPSGVLDKCMSQIDEAHSDTKKLFFSLLKEEFVNSLNPEYNDTNIVS